MAANASVAPMSGDGRDVLFRLIDGRGGRRCRVYVLLGDSMRNVRRRFDDDGHRLVTPWQGSSESNRLLLLSWR